MSGFPTPTEALANQFCQKTLPKSQWTHEAHLRVGLWHVLRHGGDEALGLLRTRIQAFNEATGVANTDTSGYHETITRFYVVLFAWFLAKDPANRELEDLADEVLRRFGDRQLLLKWYTRERLFSVEARRTWVEPDLQTLPGNSAG